MIQSKELRIGNKVLFDSEIDTIISIGQKSVNAEYKSMWSYDRIHGVPLTPEILKKCGFEKHKCSGWYFKEAKGQKFDLFHPIDCPIHYADGCFGPDLEYLHQLQNLYFALTGEELTVNI